MWLHPATPLSSHEGLGTAGVGRKEGSDSSPDMTNTMPLILLQYQNYGNLRNPIKVQIQESCFTLRDTQEMQRWVRYQTHL